MEVVVAVFVDTQAEAVAVMGTKAADGTSSKARVWDTPAPAVYGSNGPYCGHWDVVPHY